IKTGSLVALVGPSGSGKSTLLRIIAGLDTPTQGRIWLTGRDSTSLSIQEREIGFVFQNYALFKHMTVYENIAFGLDIRYISKPNKTSIKQIRSPKQDVSSQIFRTQSSLLAMIKTFWCQITNRETNKYQ